LLKPLNLEMTMLLDHASDGLTAIRTHWRNFCVVGTEPFELTDDALPQHKAKPLRGGPKGPALT
jgi:hypothetical protein